MWTMTTIYDWKSHLDHLKNQAYHLHHLPLRVRCLHVNRVLSSGKVPAAHSSYAVNSCRVRFRRFAQGNTRTMNNKRVRRRVLFAGVKWETIRCQKSRFTRAEGRTFQLLQLRLLFAQLAVSPSSVSFLCLLAPSLTCDLTAAKCSDPTWYSNFFILKSSWISFDLLKSLESRLLWEWRRRKRAKSRGDKKLYSCSGKGKSAN